MRSGGMRVKKGSPMSNSLSISDPNPIRGLECPKCNQTINTAATVCPFCSAPIDHGAAELAADSLDKVNKAVGDARYLKGAAGLIPVFLGLSFVPFLSTLGSWGLNFLLVAAPVLAIRWWFRFNGVKTADPEFAGAKKTVLSIGIVAALLLVAVIFYEMR